jgi:Tripartite tricarboxylate transporter TctB family
MVIRSTPDFFAGLMFIAIGAFFTGFSTTYSMGTAAKMGPGYFPFWIGILQMILGAIIMVSSMKPKTAQEKVARFDFKSMFLVLGAVVAFGLLLKPLGLVLSLLVLIGMASFASHDFGWKATLGNTVVLITLCLGVFVWGLNLQFPVWPSAFVK